MTFINEHSFKCLLGPQAKDINIIDNIYSWRVNKKLHFSTLKTLTDSDLCILQSIGSSNFHYLSEENALFLKQHFETHKTKGRSIILDIEDLSLNGGQYKKLRQTFKKCDKNQFEILNNFKHIDDIIKMIKEWSNEYTAKYFRDFSGKNSFFYRNSFHLNCLSLFIYSQNDLVAFGTLSQPINEQSSYIIGKALYKRFYGLSEYTDIMLYREAVKYGIKRINMGRASNKNLLFYKLKFPKSKEEIYYDGSIKI